MDPLGASTHFRLRKCAWIRTDTTRYDQIRTAMTRYAQIRTDISKYAGRRHNSPATKQHDAPLRYWLATVRSPPAKQQQPQRTLIRAHRTEITYMLPTVALVVPDAALLFMRALNALQ